jgi:hypothetical protein
MLPTYDREFRAGRLNMRPVFRTVREATRVPDRIEFGGTVCLATASEDDVASRHSRILGGRDWLRLGAVELGLDCLRRYFQKLPVYERTDFEKT